MNDFDTDFDTDLAAGLGALLDAPPPSAMDVDLARRTGRRTRRRRRTTVGSGAALLGAAALVLAFVLPGAGRQALPPPTGRPDTTTVPHGVLTGTDPLVTTLGFGWLPGGVQITGFQDQVEPANGAQADLAMLTADGGAESSGTALTLTVEPAGQPFPGAVFLDGTTAPQTPAPDVNGRPAYWTYVPGSAQAQQAAVVTLRWQYAPSDWAQLDAHFGADSSPDVVPTVYKVAEQVQFGRSARVASPFHLARVPAGLAVAADGWVSGDYWQPGQYVDPGARSAPAETLLSFAPSPSIGTSTAGLTIRVQLADSRPPTATFGDPVIAVDGHAAQSTAAPGSASLTVYGVDGLDVSIDAEGAQALADVNAVGGMVAYFRTVTLLGPDPANWTTAVVG